MENKTIYCPNCGSKIAASSVFCPKCGQKINVTVSNQTAPNPAGSSQPANHANNGNQYTNQQQPQYWQPTSSQNSNATSAGNDRNTNLYLTFGWICAVISLFLFPIIFGAGGVVFGVLLTKNEQSRNKGTILIVMSVAIGITGFLLGAALNS